MSKNPDAIDPEEAAKVARDIKSVLSQKEKVIFFYRNLELLTNYFVYLIVFKCEIPVNFLKPLQPVHCL